MVVVCPDIRVLELSSGMAGPMAAMILADHGAEVVKVEPPSGEWGRGLPAFRMWNRGKQAITLDLHDPAQRATYADLAAGSDVVIESLPPGRADRLGIGYADLAARNSALVYCSISGFGPVAEHDHVAGYEAVVAAATGRMIGLDLLSGAVPGQTREVPIYPAAPIASYGAAQLAVTGILAALRSRARSGHGQLVATSLLEASTAFLMRQEFPRGTQAKGLIDPLMHRGIELCFLTAECADGRYIQMCARQDEHFRRWMKAVGLGELLTEARFAHVPLGVPTLADLDELQARLTARMKERTQAEWMDVFARDDIGADPFLTPAEFLRLPDMTENGRVVELPDPEVGPVRMPGPLVHFSATPARIDTPAPRLGQDNHRLPHLLARTVTAQPKPEPLLRSAEPRPAEPEQAGPEPEQAGPLAGVTIVEPAFFVAGPLAGAVLAELGARVIKVEPPAGDPYRRTGLQAAKYLHGKESVVLDAKSPIGREILHRLIADSDCFVHNFRPGVAERLGLGYVELDRLNPRLVYLNAASYGSAGPQRARAAFHSTPNALAGGGILQAGEGNPPVDDSYPDSASGLAAATALMLGLAARDVNGLGQYLETTMLTSTGYLLSTDLVHYEGMPAQRLPDQGQHGLGPYYRLYQCAEGWLFLAAVTGPQRARLAEVLDLDETAGPDPAGAVAARFARGPARSWAAELQRAGVPAVVVQERTQERWLEAAGLLRPESHPAFGEYWRTGPPIRFSRHAVRKSSASALGEHTRSVLSGLGYREAEIDELVAKGIAGEPDPRLE